LTATFSLLPRLRRILWRACRGLARGVWAWAAARGNSQRREEGRGSKWRAERVV
jgi:hypothetical protein